MEVEFRNVTITITNVQNAREAYTKLCSGLTAMDSEWTTDSYIVYPGTKAGDTESVELPTTDLFDGASGW